MPLLLFLWYIVCMMEQKEKFPYEIEDGAIMDFVDGKFMFVLKDHAWSEEEIKMLKKVRIAFCFTNDLAIYVLEGGDIDSSDFYFNIQECDEKDRLLSHEILPVEIVLVDQNNEICLKKSGAFSKEESAKIKDFLKRQSEISFMPGEYDVNVSGMQAAYEPYELLKYEQCAITI